MGVSEPETLVIVHYHLLTGGVRSALELSLIGLAQSGWLDGRSVKLLVGRRDGLEDFKAALQPWSVPIAIQLDSRLDYSDKVWPGRENFWGEASALAAWLMGQGQGACLYWAHNPTIGKNPLVTAGLLEAAREAADRGAPHRFLYHIHDFAECGRLHNLLHLRRCWGTGGIEEIYPPWKNVGYAVLNSSDFSRLARAGVPKERVFYLPNAIPSRPVKREKPREAILPLLHRYARDHGYRWEPHRPWWTLPIRLIRRKNVVEALLLAAIATDPPQLLVTLDANSDPERPYAERVKGLFRRHNHAAVVGFGHDLVGRSISLDDLVLGSDALVTTSLLEGFGYAFLEGPTRGKPLVGRNIPEVTGDFVEAGFPVQSLYEHLWVPVDRQTREEMTIGGRRFARKWGRFLGVSQSRIEAFMATVKDLFSGDIADFGFLDLERQVVLAERLEETSFVQTLRSLNPKSAEPAVFPPDFSPRMEERFGLQPHAQRLAAAFEGLFTLNCRQETPADLGDRLLNVYFSPEYHRPLMGEWP